MSTTIAYGSHVVHTSTAVDRFGIVAPIILAVACWAWRAVRRPEGASW